MACSAHLPWRTGHAATRYAERSVSRWMRHAPRSPESAQRWLTFLRNHREGIAAMGLLLGAYHHLWRPLYRFLSLPMIEGTFPTSTSRAIQRVPGSRNSYARGLSLQTRQPSSDPLDHDSKYGAEVFASIHAINIKAVRTTVACPWQMVVAERWVGTCRGATIRSCDRHQRNASQPITRLFCQVLPLGSHSSCLQKPTPQERKRCSGRGTVVAWPRVVAFIIVTSASPSQSAWCSRSLLRADSSRSGVPSCRFDWRAPRRRGDSIAGVAEAF